MRIFLDPLGKSSFYTHLYNTSLHKCQTTSLKGRSDAVQSRAPGGSRAAPNHAVARSGPAGKDHCQGKA